MATDVVQFVFRFIDQTGNNIERMTRQFGAMSGALRAVGTAVAALGLGRLIQQQIDLADKVGDVAARLGESAESISRLKEAAELTDSSMDAVVRAMEFFARKGQTVTVELGGMKVAAKDLFDETASLTDQFFQLLEAINKLPNEEDKIFALAQFFGRGSAELANLLADLDNFKKRFLEAQNIITQEQADTADRLEKAQTRLFQNFQSAIRWALLEPIAAYFEAVDKLREGGGPTEAGWMGIPVPAAPSRGGGSTSGFINRGGDTPMGPFLASIEEEAKESGEKAGSSMMDEFLKGLMDKTDDSNAKERARKEFERFINSLFVDIDTKKITPRLFEDQARAIAEAARTPAQVMQDALNELELLSQQEPEILNPEVVGQAATQIVTEYQNALDQMKQDTLDWTVFAEQAFRNMQDTLADFFRGGEDMSRKFVDVILDMFAQLLASSVLRSFASFFSELGAGKGGFLGMLGGFFTKLLPGAAHGLNFSVPGSGGTDSQLVAFRASPGEHVSVGRGANGGGAGAVFMPGAIVLDARGADPASSARLMAALPMVQRAVEASIKESMRRGTF